MYFHLFHLALCQKLGVCNHDGLFLDSCFVLLLYLFVVCQNHCLHCRSFIMSFDIREYKCTNLVLKIFLCQFWPFTSIIILKISLSVSGMLQLCCFSFIYFNPIFKIYSPLQCHYKIHISLLHHAQIPESHKIN